MIPAIERTDVKEVMEKWLHYYNLWLDEGLADRGPKSTLDQWTVTDYQRNLYGHTVVVGEIDAGRAWNTSKILLIETSDGDDGGPSALTAGWSGSLLDEDLELSFIVHEFDTIPCLIWSREDGFRVPPDGDYEADASPNDWPNPT